MSSKTTFPKKNLLKATESTINQSTIPQPMISSPAILQVIPAFNAGGVERVTFETVTQLTAHGFGSHHVASAGGYYASLLPQTISHHDLSLDTKNILSLAMNSHSLYKLIKKYGIQIAHARSRAPAFSTRIACRRAGIPFITTYHGTYNDGSFAKRYYNSIMARGDRVIAISRFIMKHIEKKHPHLASNVTFVPEGIDTTYFNPTVVSLDRIRDAYHAFNVPYGEKMLLLPGRLTRWKGQAWFLKALQGCIDLLKQHKIHVVIIGDAQGRSAYRDELTALSKPLSELGVPVHFLVQYNDLPAAYAVASIVFSCSLEPEAFGRICAEVLAMGRPFIGTNHGGTVELTNNGLLGSLIAAGDDNALRHQISRALVEDQTFIANRAIAARAYIDANYSLSQMLRLTQAVYESVL